VRERRKVDAKRQPISPQEADAIIASQGDVDAVLSVIAIVELAHGIERDPRRSARYIRDNQTMEHTVLHLGAAEAIRDIAAIFGTR
jgi:hypothetical protein